MSPMKKYCGLYGTISSANTNNMMKKTNMAEL